MSQSSLQEIYCLAGHPAQGDPTQFMMERAFERSGLDARCLTFEVAEDQLSTALAGLNVLGVRGVRLTTPHARPAAACLARLTPVAAACGAVNVVTRVDDQMVGDNTIGRGFLAALAEQCDPRGKRVVLLGAGGAARAIAAELLNCEIEQLTVVNRTLKVAEQLVEHFLGRSSIPIEAVAWQGDYAIPPTTDILVHCTSLNHFQIEERAPVKWPPATGLMVVDMNFNPVESRFLREARDRGLPRLGGLKIFVNQSALIYESWTGRDADRALLQDAAEEFFG